MTTNEVRQGLLDIDPLLRGFLQGVLGSSRSNSPSSSNSLEILGSLPAAEVPLYRPRGELARQIRLRLPQIDSPISRRVAARRARLNQGSL